ncbi:hypothetical protein MKX01_038624 [Papaver californicum]|nr:hypothetical protein MKX01_038624 [Papaver californicum]
MESMARGLTPTVIVIGAGMSEATDRIGGRIKKTIFSGVSVEMGANWVEGVNEKKEVNPIWTMANKIGLNSQSSFPGQFNPLIMAFYIDLPIHFAFSGGLYNESEAQKIIESAEEFFNFSANVSVSLLRNGVEDISILTAERLRNKYDSQQGEPPRLTSLWNTVPSQTDLISFVPHLPISLICLSTPKFSSNSLANFGQLVTALSSLFTPMRDVATTLIGRLYGWQQVETEYPGANCLLVTVTDDESRRIEQQSDSKTKAEIMEVLRNMFGDDIPEATDILVPRWWSDKFYMGCFSNWPVGLSRRKFNQIKSPVDRIYFTGEHTSEKYFGYVHGAYLAGIDSANSLINCVKKKECNPKDDQQIKLQDENVSVREEQRMVATY